MKFDFPEALATAALIGSEVFVIAFGTAWLTLSTFHYSAWRLPAVGIGVVAALWSATAIFQLSERAGAEEASLVESEEDRAD